MGGNDVYEEGPELMNLFSLSLAQTAVLMGSVLALLHLPALFAPGFFRRAVLAFPRHDWSAWLLTAVSLTWATLIVLNAPLGRFEWMKPGLYVVAPVTFLLMVFFLGDLLAPRALGGFLLLVANPVLNVTRWHDSPLRLVVTTVTYLLIIAGMILVLSPYRFRQFMALWVENPDVCRVGGALAVLLGGGLILLGLTVY
jgi:hypothetical protein